MKNSRVKIISLLLLFTILFNFSYVSCKPKGDDGYRDIRLTINEIKTKYTVREIKELTNLILKLSVKFIEQNLNIKLSSSKKKSIENNIESKIIPIFEDNSLDFQEGSEFIAEITENLNKDINIKAIFDIYIKMVSEIGGKTASGIIYDFAVKTLKEKERDCREKYEKFGYLWYKEDAERYGKILVTAEKIINKEDFYKISDLFLFIFSFTAALTNENTEISSTLTNMEKVTILHRQSEVFSTYNVSKEQWKIASELIVNAIPNEILYPQSLKGFPRLEAEYLVNAGYTGNLMGCMEELTALLCKIAAQTNENTVDFETKEELMRFISKTLKNNENDFRSFVNAFEKGAEICDDGERNELKLSHEEKEFENFAKTRQKGVTNDDLINKIFELENDSTEEKLKETEKILKDYLFGIAPYVTYAVNKTASQKGNK